MDNMFSKNLNFFTEEEITALKNRTTTKTNEKTGKQTHFVNCIIRNKEIQLKPEEIVRQLYAKRLITEYGYVKEQIKFEHPVVFGHEQSGKENKSADIVIFQKNKQAPYIIVELKKAKLTDGKDQLKSYTNATGAPMAVWTNGQQISYYHRKDPNYFEAITNIPKATETLADIVNKPFLISDLEKENILVTQRKSLREIIKELEDEVLANAGVDPFEEIFKLIFIKLHDEYLSAREHARPLVFYKTIPTNNRTETDYWIEDDNTDKNFKQGLENLFVKAKEKWPGVFSKSDKIELIPSHLAICGSYLQKIMLFNSNLEVVDEAFEYLINRSSKGEKGQYFTPRYVIDMCVKMLNPQEHESIIDTAAGSCGFPVHAMLHVWNRICQRLGYPNGHLMTAADKPEECKKYVREKVFAIDFDKRVVRVARTLNLIAGDGETNVLHLNALDYRRWGENEADKAWKTQYGMALARLREYKSKEENIYGELIEQDDDKNFNFDILLANPPFAGDIRDPQILHNYELAKRFKIKVEKTQQVDRFGQPFTIETIKKERAGWYGKIGRDILFIERNISFLKPGGRMAIVLPQGRFNNSSDAHIRNFLAERGRILAVVGLHGNVFKPHTGTKTSVLLWQKWTDKDGINPKKEDYPIFFATMQKPSKDNSGDKIYIEIENQNGDKERELDHHKHLIVDHDLFNHDGKTEDGIYEAFREFAKREHLSFFFGDIVPFNKERYNELLEQLEVSEVALSQMHKAGRMDSEYYKKEYVFDKNLITQLPNDKLKNLTKSILSFGAYSLNNFVEYQEQGIPFIRVANMKGGRINFSDMRYITENAYQLLWKSAVEPETVLVSMAGTIGEVAISSKKWKYPINSNQGVSKIITNTKLNPYFLYIFLLGKFGQYQLKQEARGSVQQGLFLSQIENFDIPLLSENFQKYIQEIVEKSEDIHTQAENLYSQAETLLLDELKLTDYQPNTQNIAEVSLSQMLQVGRMDAEYFQPKYAEFVEHLKSYSFGCTTLGELVENYSTGYPFSTDDYLEKSTLPLIRINNIKNALLDLSNAVFLPEEHKNISQKDIAKENDILISMSGSIGLSCKIDRNINAMVNQRILKIAIQNFNPDILVLILNSVIARTQLKRIGTGGVQVNISASDILNVHIPLIPQPLQTEIAELIQQSHALRAESKKLLEVAKKAVEMAIEQDEEEAITFLNNEVNTTSNRHFDA